MRNPFARQQKEPGGYTGIVNLDELEPRMHAWIAEHPEAPDIEMNVQINAAILDLAVEAASSPEAQKEGRWVIFLIDKDGFVMDQQGEYLLPQEVRDNNTFVRLAGSDAESDA